MGVVLNHVMARNNGTTFQEEKQKASTKRAAAPKETSAEAALYREGTVLL